MTKNHLAGKGKHWRSCGNYMGILSKKYGHKTVVDQWVLIQTLDMISKEIFYQIIRKFWQIWYIGSANES